MEKSRPSLREIINFRKESFAKESVRQGYVTHRGMYRQREPVPPFSYVQDGYVEILPTVEGKTIDQLIDDKIQEAGSARILDVGCGSGIFLQDCKEKWGDKIEAFGITSVDYDLKDKAESKPVAIGIGDAQSLIRTLRANGMPTAGYDFVVSVMTMFYLEDELSAIKQINKVLADDGMALIDRSTYTRDVVELFDGFEGGDRSLWFRKIKPRLVLPEIRYDIFDFHGRRNISHVRSLIDIRHRVYSEGRLMPLTTSDLYGKDSQA